MTPLPETKVETENHSCVRTLRENPTSELVSDKQKQKNLPTLDYWLTLVWLDTHENVANIGLECVCCDVLAGGQIGLPMTHWILNP